MVGRILCFSVVARIDDEHLVATHLRRNLHLAAKFADVVDGVVGGGVELVDAHAASFGESLAALTLAAGVAVGVGREAVDGFGKDAGAGGLAHTARTAEEISVCQFSRADGVLERGGQRALPDDGVERQRTVL